MKNYIQAKTERIISQINSIQSHSEERRSNAERIIDFIEDINK